MKTYFMRFPFLFYYQTIDLSVFINNLHLDFNN